MPAPLATSSSERPRTQRPAHRRSAPRPRVLFVGSNRLDLPLPPGLARKWDAVANELDIRVIGRARRVTGKDRRFRLIHARPPFSAGSFYASLPLVATAEIRRFRPDVVITQSPYEAFACLPSLARRGSPRLIVELHGDWRTASRLYGSRLRRVFAGLADRAAAFAMRRADGVRALSPFTASLAEEATGRKPVATFTTYFDLESFTATPRQPLPADPAIAWIGVLERYKDPHTLAEAWRIAAPKVPEARLVVVGRGPRQPLVDQLVSEFPTRVRAVSWLEPPQVARLLDDSTLLALSSAEGAEGVPRVIMEAFVRGRPVVATAVGGVPDIVEPGRNGFVVEPGNPEQFADALVRALTDRKLTEQLAAGAWEDGRGSQWSPESYAGAVRGMVDQVRAGS
jgi:glycosyltransferase involved in cell wall biosynthesis